MDYSFFTLVIFFIRRTSEKKEINGRKKRKEGNFLKISLKRKKEEVRTFG